MYFFKYCRLGQGGGFNIKIIFGERTRRRKQKKQKKKKKPSNLNSRGVVASLLVGVAEPNIDLIDEPDVARLVGKGQAAHQQFNLRRRVAGVAVAATSRQHPHQVCAGRAAAGRPVQVVFLAHSVHLLEAVQRFVILAFGKLGGEEVVNMASKGADCDPT